MGRSGSDVRTAVIGGKLSFGMMVVGRSASDVDPAVIHQRGSICTPVWVKYGEIGRI